MELVNSASNESIPEDGKDGFSGRSLVNLAFQYLLGSFVPRKKPRMRVAGRQIAQVVERAPEWRPNSSPKRLWEARDGHAGAHLW